MPVPPAPTIDSAPQDPGLGLSAQFAFSDSQAGVTFLGRLDGDSFVAVESPLFYAGPLSAGSHTFQVKATDGIEQSAAASHTWRVPFTLDDLEQSVESKIARALHAMIKADVYFSDIFKPILLVETPTMDALLDYAVNTAVVQPWSIAPNDRPSQRETLLFAVIVAFYVPLEQTSQDSKLYWLRLYNRVRRLVWTAPVVLDPDDSMTRMNFATTRVDPQRPVQPRARGVRILAFKVVFETDIRPKTGQRA